MMSPDQCRAARVLLGWSAVETAAAATVGIATLKRFESGQAVAADTVVKIAQALIDAGVILISDGETSALGRAGVRLA